MITVVVCTFNADWEKIKKTLFSIIRQKEILYEILVADDGSINNNFDMIRKFFLEHEFYNYSLIANKDNKGTVLNILGAIEDAKGEYVKVISPGDYLYDEFTLRKFWNEIEKSKKEVYFGKSIYYQRQADNLCFFEGVSPRDLNVYKKKKYKWIRRNYLVKRDYILGASFVIKTSIFLEYLKRISGLIKYAEDCSVICMVADGIYPVFIDEYILWYEYGTGISTSAQSKWAIILYNENKNIFDKLYEKKLINRFHYGMYYHENSVIRLLSRLLVYPMYFVFRKKNCSKKVKNENKFFVYKSIISKIEKI